MTQHVSYSLNVYTSHLLGLFVLVSYLDSSTLFCTSEDLYASFSQATPFCIITGKIVMIIIPNMNA